MSSGAMGGGICTLQPLGKYQQTSRFGCFSLYFVIDALTARAHNATMMIARLCFIVFISLLFISNSSPGRRLSSAVAPVSRGVVVAHAFDFGQGQALD
jgi:hypothetical protein